MTTESGRYERLAQRSTRIMLWLCGAWAVYFLGMIAVLSGTRGPHPSAIGLVMVPLILLTAGIAVTRYLARWHFPHRALRSTLDAGDARPRGLAGTYETSTRRRSRREAPVGRRPKRASKGQRKRRRKD